VINDGCRLSWGYIEGLEAICSYELMPGNQGIWRDNVRSETQILNQYFPTSSAAGKILRILESQKLDFFQILPSDQKDNRDFRI